MFLMGEIGDDEYYTQSEENQFTPKKLEDYLNADAGCKAEIISDLFPQVRYSKTAFTAMFEGKNPSNNADLIKKQPNHKPGYDIVHTQSKGYSILYSSAPPQVKKQMDEIYRRELKKLIEEEFKQRIVPSCKKGKYREFDQNKTKISLALFQHIENRNVDPHVHNHITLMNFAEFTMKDGTKKTLAIDPQELFSDQKYISEPPRVLRRLIGFNHATVKHSC